MRRTLLKCLASACLLSSLPVFAADENGATYGNGKNSFALATGSPGELGLLKVLAETFVASADGQKIIADYGRERFGEGLYNDAAYARQFD